VALTRKGSRQIVVDGDTYRWRIRRKPSYSQGVGQASFAFAVEDAATPGTTLVARTGQPHPGNWLGLPATPIRPADVARAIRIARARGWSPHANGSPFILDLSDTTDDASA
jgi:hypothetical protein